MLKRHPFLGFKQGNPKKKGWQQWAKYAQWVTPHYAYGNSEIPITGLPDNYRRPIPSGLLVTDVFGNPNATAEGNEYYRKVVKNAQRYVRTVPIFIK